MTRRRKLRKQPKMRRMDVMGNVVVPNIVVPPEAKKRKRRNNKRLNSLGTLVKKVVLSTRWISLALIVVCGWVIYVIGHNDDFFLTNFPIQGASSISHSSIIGSSGLMDSHIIAADPGEAAAKIGQLPGVVSATVTLEWPNTVYIRVAEDLPIAIWEQAGERYWIGEDGQLLPGTNSTALLVIHSEEEETMGEDGFIATDVLLGALMLRDLRPNIEKLYYRPGQGLSYQDGRGWRVFFGSGQDMDQKLVVYETIVADLVERAITPAYVSVRNQIKPYYAIATG